MRKANNKKLMDDLATRADTSLDAIDRYKKMSDERLQRDLDDTRSFFNDFGFVNDSNPYKKGKKIRIAKKSNESID